MFMGGENDTLGFQEVPPRDSDQTRDCSAILEFARVVGIEGVRATTTAQLFSNYLGAGFLKDFLEGSGRVRCPAGNESRSGSR